MAYYVFRIHDGQKFEYVRNEIINGRLRQGWGANGMSILEGFEKFNDSWDKIWGEGDTSKEQRQRKFNNLSKMSNISIGDIIVIPKISLQEGYDVPCRCFTIVECIEPYKFINPNDNIRDFGHVIGVKPILSCSYDYNAKSMNISGKFRAYQSSINNVWNVKFQNSVEELIRDNAKSPIKSENIVKNTIYAIADEISDQYEQLIDSVIDTISGFSPQKFERIITELFEKNNYIRVRGNDYDGSGGDIDISLAFDDKSLLGNILKISETIEIPYINIQAKKKPGNDYNDIDAVNQLIERSKSKKRSNTNDMNLVIDLANDFQKTTKQHASDNGIILINGRQFASLLIQFGISGELND